MKLNVTITFLQLHNYCRKVLFMAFLAINFACFSVHAQTVWNGPTMIFSTNSGGGAADLITSNVSLTRGATQGLYNNISEASYTHNLSPAGTEWSYGSLANFASLTYLSWEAWNGGKPPTMVNQNAVLHLKTENIYIGIKFLSWETGRTGDGGFSYERTTPSSLPVTLTSFKAFLQKQNTLLTWETATEINNQYFNIEHSRDGLKFASIGRVECKGNSTTRQSYSFTHINILNGKHFYRLAQYDFNGAVHFSPVLVISREKQFNVELAPNPASTFLNVRGSASLIGATYSVHAPSGQVIKKGVINNQQLNVTFLSPGWYSMVLFTPAGVRMQSSFLKK